MEWKKAVPILQLSACAKAYFVIMFLYAWTCSTLTSTLVCVVEASNGTVLACGICRGRTLWSNILVSTADWAFSHVTISTKIVWWAWQTLAVAGGRAQFCEIIAFYALVAGSWRAVKRAEEVWRAWHTFAVVAWRMHNICSFLAHWEWIKGWVHTSRTVATWWTVSTHSVLDFGACSNFILTGRAHRAV